jgi:cytidylate kinase
VLNHQVPPDDALAVAQIAEHLDVSFHVNGVTLEGQEVSSLIRQEHVGNLASRLAPNPALRAALLARQRAFRRLPGLVADGRDMGTIVFPDADLKIFLVADVLARAERRYKQLIDKGISANLEDLLADMRERDRRDIDRSVAPLVAAQGAHTIDSSKLTIDQTVQTILSLYRT